MNALSDAALQWWAVFFATWLVAAKRTPRAAIVVPDLERALDAHVAELHRRGLP